ncbi:MAG: bifunctional riboflavin kinase/FMN adenylyltransferase [Oscillospiraceae bacterium]|nr:bifunctional riboflavin kinase/FMN adenylyltransferase [Oscillospiraceae bacterium]
MANVKRVIALGFFDGIHIGHMALLRRTLEIASGKDITPCVITFDALPQNLINASSSPVPLINSPQDRAGLISRLFGIDDIIFLRFDKKLAAMPWDEFIDFLAMQYGARHFVVGGNFRFGSGRAGNSAALEQKCRLDGLGCDIIEDVIYDNVVSSSTYIRKLLACGGTERANAFLGHAHILTDIVRRGERLGRNLDAPTINMRFAPGVLVPAFGVYATRVYINLCGDERTVGTRRPDARAAGITSYRGAPVAAIDDGLLGVTNIGVRPTVDDSGNITVETHIPDYNHDLYERKVRVEFYKRLRPEIKFSDIKELRAQIQKDCALAKAYFDNR